jgi:hypothetical protein
VSDLQAGYLRGILTLQPTRNPWRGDAEGARKSAAEHMGCLGRVGQNVSEDPRAGLQARGSTWGRAVSGLIPTPHETGRYLRWQR